ncbi:cobyric acid synthase [Oscillospiraceae bacterium PP1C4]
MAKAIMVQGTTSNAGKSLLTAALCRIFKQDGYSVAPFKSQNMALNSFITSEGLEMGRAQVMQAEAAGIAPSVLMNPILLKPSSDTGSQVIVNGEVLGNMSAKDYFAMKGTLIPQIMEAYNALAAKYDIIVLEGAGSPAEINLKSDDIVNMGMAKLAKAPVLLAGDIDRGGVFASLTGTLMLLEADERAMVKGMIINKFRGDKTILQPGLDMLEQITGAEVLGVVPYLKLDIDDEDSLSERLDHSNSVDMIDIAVIRLPRLSNFTDFNPLASIDGVSLRYVKTVAQLGHPDLIILPGTKNTMEDLLWLRQCGLEAAIQKHVAAGGAVLGICGGYQMLGAELHDPDNVEHGGSMAGMGLLKGSTVFASQKTRTQVTGRFQKVGGILSELSGAAFEGYEIHMGKTDAQSPLTCIQTLNGAAVEQPDGAASGNVYGSYVHGIFDHEEAAKALVVSLCKAKGLDWEKIAALDLAAHKERQYDLLAQGVRESLDMTKIYEILEQGI